MRSRSYFSLCVVGLVFVAVPFSAALNAGKFWHVTDFHYDHTYWGDKLSCNNDVPNPGVMGDYWCDSPWRLVTSAVDAMSTISPDVDFLLWTGDTVAHIKDDHLNETINMEVLGNITNELRRAFPKKTVYATYGNHDYYPSDQFPNLNNLIYNLTADIWNQWINEPAQLDNFRKGGYYTRLTNATGKLRILALNTNLYYTSNKQTKGIADPSDQLQWMKNVLLAARTNGEKVIVTAHIPPGVHTPSRVSWFYDEFVQPVNAALQEFADVIVGMHFGHDHHDGFKVFYNAQGQAATPLFVAPSVTPWRYKLPSGETGPPHNPSVRLVTFDRDTGRHLDIEQYKLDLPRSNQPGGANFTLLYRFTDSYNVTDLSADSLEKLVTRMSTGSEGEKLLGNYIRFSVAGADQSDSKACDSKCKAMFLCGFRHYTLKDFDECVQTLTSAASSLPLSAAATAFSVLLSVVLAWNMS